MADKKRYFAAFVPSLNRTLYRASPTMVYTGVILKNGEFFGYTTKGRGDVPCVEITKEAYKALVDAKAARIEAARAERDAKGWSTSSGFGSEPTASWVEGNALAEQVAA